MLTSGSQPSLLARTIPPGHVGVLGCIPRKQPSTLVRVLQYAAVWRPMRGARFSLPENGNTMEFAGLVSSIRPRPPPDFPLVLLVGQPPGKQPS